MDRLLEMAFFPGVTGQHRCGNVQNTVAGTRCPRRRFPTRAVSRQASNHGSVFDHPGRNISPPADTAHDTAKRDKLKKAYF